MNEPIIDFIKKHGAKETFAISKAIALKRYGQFKTEMGEHSRLDQQFEFELFVMGFILSYLEKNETFFLERVDFADIIEREYGRYVEKFLIDPLESRVFYLTVPNADIYAYRKLKAYQTEVLKLTENPEYISKYIFSAFNMYPLLENEIIEQKCVTLVESNIEWFQLIVNSFISMLKSDLESI